MAISGVNLKNCIVIIAAAALTACQSSIFDLSNVNDASNGRSYVITNVRIVDGTGAPARLGAVRIEGDRITAVYDIDASPQDVAIDGRGLVLAPGFIDPHSHHDIGLLEAPSAEKVLSQGVTTIVVGQDGFHNYPLADYWADIEGTPPAVNVASFAGHNRLRLLAMEDDPAALSQRGDIEEMRRLLTQEMSAGALGLSTGLAYEPGRHAPTYEVIELAKEAAAFGGIYATHMRNESSYIWEAIEETLTIGRESGAPLHFSHMKLGLSPQWGQADRFLGILENAAAEGMTITGDIYPYDYSLSSFMVLLPGRDYDNRESVERALKGVTPDRLRFTNYKPDPSVIGKTLAEVAAERGEDPVDTYMAFAAELLKSPTAQIDATFIARAMHEDDVAALTAWSRGSVSSDGANEDEHPRGAGSFPRAFRLFVRERGLISLEDMVLKMTSQTADALSIADRGRIAPGAYADLVLFDPETVSDRADVEAPGRLSVGVEKVWVNGALVWDSGAPTTARPGRAVKHASVEGGNE